MKKNKQSPARRSGIAGPSTAAKEAINHPVQPPSYNHNRATQHQASDRSRSRNHRSRSPKCAAKVVVDADGRRGRELVPARVKQWWWKTSDGKLLFTIQYGSRALELAKGKPAVEVGNMQELIEALQSVRAATEAGELDGHIETASASLGVAFKRKTGKSGARAA